MVPKVTSLLCLVLCLGQRIPAQEGNWTLPAISAVPSSVIPRNETAKVLCKGTPESYQYSLEILRNSKYQVVKKNLGFQEVSEFIIHPMDTNSAGRYRCQYWTHKGLSKYSDILDLVVTGLYDEPFLSADLGQVVVLGENIFLQCGSANIPFDRFSLTKEGSPIDLPQHQNGTHQGTFTLGPVNHDFSGNYSCYGWFNMSPHVWSSPSNVLELVVPDTMGRDSIMQNVIQLSVAGLVLVALLVILVEDWHSRKVLLKENRQDLAEPNWSKQELWVMPSTLPSLLCLGLCLNQVISSPLYALSKPIVWAKPNSIIPKGKPVAIWCQGIRGALEYQLLYKGQLSALKRQKSPELKNKVLFSIPAMTLHTAGGYSCIYLSGKIWSEQSDTLDLVVTGMYDVPTLSVQPGPQVILGESVTFHCSLETATNTFFLLKEGRRSSFPQQRYGKQQAVFSMGPMTPAHRGTYRCFGSYNDFAWSFPSPPVELRVTGENTLSVPLVLPGPLRPPLPMMGKVG
ncbi:PREDICTED: immunoglobulin alpha Fc receptor [Chrysochloris asiatica]|uniref:immunoglobulin alpha Fc receptor n=1 Tax=Chrysochloris asiatica TaxID=185453 RepID=UPI0003F11B28|nr:PREDICTED: immunoglobulin alpha Fc receptor [Chrysochloris asiatica]